MAKSQIETILHLISTQLGYVTVCLLKSTMKDKDRYIYVMRSLLARNCPTNMYIKNKPF